MRCTAGEQEAVASPSRSWCPQLLEKSKCASPRPGTAGRAFVGAPLTASVIQGCYFKVLYRGWGQKDHCDQCEEKVVPISSSMKEHNEQWGVWELWHHPLVAPLHDHQTRSPVWCEEGPQCKHPKYVSSPTPEWAPFKFLFGDWEGEPWPSVVWAPKKGQQKWTAESSLLSPGTLGKGTTDLVLISISCGLWFLYLCP